MRRLFWLMIVLASSMLMLSAACSDDTSSTTDAGGEADGAACQSCEPVFCGEPAPDCPCSDCEGLEDGFPNHSCTEDGCLAANDEADAGTDAEGSFPSISALNVVPSSVSQAEVASVDWDVSITITDFEGAITEADAFIQLDGDSRSSGHGEFEVSGDTVTLVDVNQAWFQGLEPGTYDLGASIVSDAGEEVTQLDLATVTIEQ